MMRHLVFAAALAFATTAQAQSLPNISGIKQTTNRAVNKTNAHTLAMTNVDSAANAAKSTAPNGSSAAKKPVESPVDTAKSHGVRATASAATRASVADTAGKVVLRREVFSYEQSGRRDPFVSLMTVGELRPM